MVVCTPAISTTTRAIFPTSIFTALSSFLFSSCTDGQHRTGSPVHVGIIRSRCILYASAYQAHPVKRAPGGAASATAYRFCPELIEQSISTLMLRRTHSRQLHAGASFAEMAARSFTGLERKGGRCCTAPFRYAGQPVSKFPGFHGKQPRRRCGLTPFAALPPIRSALRHIKSSPASAVQGCLSYAREETHFVSAALFFS